MQSAGVSFVRMHTCSLALNVLIHVFLRLIFHRNLTSHVILMKYKIEHTQLQLHATKLHAIVTLKAYLIGLSRFSLVRFHWLTTGLTCHMLSRHIAKRRKRCRLCEPDELKHLSATPLIKMIGAHWPHPRVFFSHTYHTRRCDWISSHYLLMSDRYCRGYPYQSSLEAGNVWKTREIRRAFSDG